MITLTQRELRFRLLELIPFKLSGDEYVGAAAILERYVISRTKDDKLPTQQIIDARLMLLKKVYQSNRSPVEAVNWATESENFAIAENTPEWIRFIQETEVAAKSEAKAEPKAAKRREL